MIRIEILKFWRQHVNTARKQDDTSKYLLDVLNCFEAIPEIRTTFRVVGLGPLLS